MFYRLFIAILFIAISLSKAHAQDFLKLEFEDGTTKNFRYIYDDPTRIPKWSAGVNWGMGITGVGNMILLFHGDYRINNDMWIDAKYIHTLINTEDYDRSAIESKYYKELSEISATFHFSLLSSTSIAHKKIAVDGDRSVIYIAKLPKVLRHQLLIDGGISSFRSPGFDGFITEKIDVNNDRFRYHLATMRNTSLNLGFSYNKSNCFKFETDGITSAYSANFRVYAYAQMTLIENPIYVIKGDGVYEPSNPGPDAFESPKFNPFGWRFGFEGKNNFRNKKIGLSGGIEFGALPSYVMPKDDLATFLFVARVGIFIGQDPQLTN